MTFSKLAIMIFLISSAARIAFSQSGTFSKDDTSAAPWQALMYGSTNANIQLITGVNTSSTPFGSVQAFKQTVGPLPLVLQNVGGNVGVGTTSPAASLDIWKPYSAGTDSLRFSYNDGSAYWMGVQPYVVAAGNVGYRFRTNNINTTVDSLAITGSGNVGLGTTVPATSLHVVKPDNSDNNGPAFFDAYSGSSNMTPNITIRTAHGSVLNPGVTQAGDPIAGFAGAGFTSSGSFGIRAADIRYWAAENYTATTQGSSITLETTPVGTVQRQIAVTIAPSGNVGVGVNNPTQKLSVNGTVRAKEVVVETTGWSDYVFADDYKLKPLSEVEQHIQKEGHLPGIPSAQEVAEKGVGLGEMQAKLLAKIEELTLHVIEQQKRIERLTEQNSELSSRLKAVEAR